ncbi:MAG: hypothetical protein V5A38_03185 [Halolamina sp.]|uniref:hypothetical protein n=1 Tax=Halolamina sp. TaxID=1940283 RepID=UPI002FC3C6B0
MDADLRNRVEGPFRRVLQDHEAGPTVELDPGDPWRPVRTALHLVGGERVQAVHLNDPVDDGTPNVQNGVPDGMRAVVEFCREHEVAIVLEPGPAEAEQVAAALEWLRGSG